MDSRGKDDPDRCAGAAILCSKLINRQIKKQIHAGVSVLLCLFGWVILRFRGFLSIGVAKRPAFSWTGCSLIPAKSPIESE